ncbi:MAG: hypothetical protein ACUVQV_06725 [Dissulfurimicrobium sp.]|uniref:hypothetical protein n=1 Tax=Dissulfurimicrobium sp. TaxID=2022436 RepID=UPI00404AE5EC
MMLQRVTGLKFEALMGADLKSILLGKTNNQLSCVCDDIHKGHIIRNRRVFLPGRVHTGDSDAVLNDSHPISNDERKFDGAVVLLRNAVDEAVISELALESTADGVFTVDKD